MDEKKSFFELLDGKSALIVGFVGGLLLLGTIGCIILGIKYFTGGGNQAAYAPAPYQPSAPAAGALEPEPVKVDIGVGHFPALGKTDAKVTVVELADYRCPFCERFYQDAAKGIIKDFVNTGKVKFYYRNFVILGPASQAAANASECANEQGKFWQFHDWLFENQADESDTAYYSKENLIKYAGKLGFNTAKFASCLNSEKYAAGVTEDFNAAQAAGAQSTPTIYINGKPLVGAQPYSVVKAAIEQALAE